MRKRILSKILPFIVAAAFLPLRSDGGQPECCNVTGSLASTVNDPVAGDEAFFKLPTGPANVMLLIDQSGSMADLPQCGDYDWDNGSALKTCKSPNLPTPSPSCTATSYTSYSCTGATVTGTCAPNTDGYTTTTSNLTWMESVVLQPGYADPGRTNALLWDCPLWGNGGSGCGTRVCSGNGCLFDPAATYIYNSWSVSGSSPYTATATRYELDGATGTSSPNVPTCTALDSSGNVIKDVAGNLVSLGSDCTTCMANKGFYIYKLKYVSSITKSGSKYYPQLTTVGPKPLFKGTFLNANPPKFVTARKVMKDLAWMDPANPNKLDQVRLGLVSMDSGGSSPRKARLIVPSGPNKTNSYPPSQNGFRQARQYIISALNGDATSYTASDGTQIVNGSQIDDGFFHPANGSTPFASAIFNAGQYFTTTNLYKNTFGTSYQTTEFVETSEGRVHAPWAATNACSVCWACQNNSIVAITDGSPNSEITFHTTINNYDSATYVLPSNCGTSGNNCISPTDGTNKSRMPRVASWLHNNDLRDNGTAGGVQALTIHTIGINIGLPTNSDGTVNKAATILAATAHMGGGIYQNADDPSALADAVFNAVNQVIPKENSFSAASANSLQTVQTAASEAYLTRFKPNQTITWEGHLFQGVLFDEYLNGCDPSLPAEDPDHPQPQVTCGPKTISANFNGDEDSVTGKSICTGVFLVDAECDEVAEDPTTGNFVKKGVGTPAAFPWDAGAVLSNAKTLNADGTPSTTNMPGYRSADETASNARNIFTVVNGARVDFKSTNAAALKPYLNISSSWCSTFLTRIGVSGGTDPTLECAKEIIHFVRGWDVLDQDSDGCAGPGKTNSTSCQRGVKGEERDRQVDSNATEKFFWKLGDIFHSSPAVLQAPINDIVCDLGYEKQCTSAIHSPVGFGYPTEMATYTVGGKTLNAYQAYREDNIARKRLVLVGANDGMLHAFHAGDAETTQPRDIFGSYTYTSGTGEELWAFVPPDMLPRLRGLLDAHQYMVDGSVMLRDVWTDGGATGNPSAADGKKQKDEFHTIAIVGRRSGGNQYSAIDVTDPMNPVFRWNFPESCSDDARYMAQSWADFAPRPPPIGPVKIKSSASRGFDERWMVMINGGYDPTLTRGRAVFMVDTWTGKTIWRFTEDDFKDNVLSLADRPNNSMFPVPAGIGLIDLGDTSKAMPDLDLFPDTATWGDMGGNVWVARFQEPGVIDSSTGRVNNWFAARAFEESRRTDGKQMATGRSEFFFMTANVFESNSQTLRVMLGSGNREQIMTQQATCGTDNLFGCCQAGCTNVTATTTDNFSGCTITDTFSCVNGQLTHNKATKTGSCPSPLACTASPTSFTTDVALHFECPGATTTDLSGQVSCDPSGSCTVASVGSTNIVGTFTTPPPNRFYGIWAYGKHAKKMFGDQASAQEFDKNRFTDVAYSGTCSGPSGNSCSLIDTTHAKVTFALSSPYIISSACDTGSPGCSAGVNDAGWFYEYGKVCPLKTCDPAPPWIDEKTGSNANVVLGCTTWGGFRPYGMEGGTDPCTGDLGTPASYGYFADYTSGVPTGACHGDVSSDGTTTTLHRAGRQKTTAPPTGSTVRVTISPDGTVNYSALQINAGSSPVNTAIGVRSGAGEAIYWLEVPRQLHTCRHEDANSCQ